MAKKVDKMHNQSMRRHVRECIAGRGGLTLYLKTLCTAMVEFVKFFGVTSGCLLKRTGCFAPLPIDLMVRFISKHVVDYTGRLLSASIHLLLQSS